MDGPVMFIDECDRRWVSECGGHYNDLRSPREDVRERLLGIYEGGIIFERGLAGDGVLSCQRCQLAKS